MDQILHWKGGTLLTNSGAIHGNQETDPKWREPDMFSTAP